MSGLSMFIPLTKIDVEKRLVYGIATAEQPDRSGEVMDYATTKPYYEKWSNDLHAASGGLSKGNLRAMHGKTAAGKLTDINFNDAAKQIEICAKVVDDNEWKKVEEGVYTGFSHGGSYAKRWTDNGVKRYTAQPNEVSLVDLPCLASATFEMVKGEGLVETRHFAEAVTVHLPTNVEVAAKAADLAKAAGVEDFAPYLDTARDELTKAVLPPPPPLDPVDKTEGNSGPVAEGVAAPDAVSKAAGSEGEQVWLSKRDGSTHATKADMRRHHAKIDADVAARAEAAPALDALAELTKTLNPAPATHGARLIKAVGEDRLEKGLNSVSRLASIIQDLAWLQNSVQAEAVREGDGSTVPATIMDTAKALGAALVAMTSEEVGELFSQPQATPDYMYMAAGKVPDDHLGALVKFVDERPALAKLPAMEKVGARNSRKDASKIQAMHDHACDLGATCKPDAAKAESAGDLQKRHDALEAERDEALEKRDEALIKHAAMKEVVDSLAPQIAALKKAFDQQPVPLHLVGRAMSKVEDAGGKEPLQGDDLEKILAAMTPDARALLMTKVAQTMPNRIGA